MLGETGEASYRRRCRELREDQFDVRPDEVLAAVNRALGAMPLYRRLGYPEEVSSLAELAALPVLGKRTLVGAKPSELMPRGLSVASVLASGALQLITSSGSSAQVSVWSDPSDADVLPPAAFEMVGASLETLRRVYLLSSPICSGGLCEIGGEGDFVILPPTANVFREDDSYFESVWRMLDDLPPGLLLTNPAILCATLAWARRRARPVRFSGVVVSSYQRITKTQQRFIEAAGLRVVNQYGATELAGCIAANSCVGGTLHVWSRRCFVEVLDEDGRAAPHGQEGDIVVTNVAANGTCLVRYRVGDRGGMHLVDCGCGVSSLGLDVNGRANEIVLYRDRRVSEAMLDAALGAMPGIVTWQFSQRHGATPLMTVIADEDAPDIDAVRAALIGEVCDDVIVRVADEVQCSQAQKYPALKTFDRRAFT